MPRKVNTPSCWKPRTRPRAVVTTGSAMTPPPRRSRGSSVRRRPLRNVHPVRSMFQIVRQPVATRSQMFRIGKNFHTIHMSDDLQELDRWYDDVFSVHRYMGPSYAEVLQR